MSHEAESSAPPEFIQLPKPWWAKPGFWILVVFLVAFVTAAYISWPRITHRYKTWKADRRAARATAFLEKGDFKSALIDAQKSLEANPSSAEATLVIARTLESVGASRAALNWRRRVEMLRPGDSANYIAWARDAVNSADVPAAAQALESVKPEDRNSAEYHDVAASIAMSRQDWKTASSHLGEACRLDPKNDIYRLRLAALNLKSSTPGEREAGLKTLEELREKPETRLPALRTLIEDATRQGNAPRALELGDALVADPKSTFNDKLLRLSVLQALRLSEFFPALEALQKVSVSKPGQLYALISMMNDRNLTILAAEWIASLPPELVSSPPVCVAVADSYARSADWPKLRAAVENASWQDFEFLRLAYLSKALERLGNPDQAKEMWDHALTLAGKRSDWLEALARLASDRGWQQQAEDALKELAVMPTSPRWALDALWSDAMRNMDSESLFKVSRQLFQNSPNELAARNNFICLALLTHNERDESHKLAEQLYANSPDSPEVAATWGLSLFKRGKIKEAVGVMSRFTPEQLRQPSVALYYGVFLAADGQFDKAREYLRIGEKSKLLPEEKALAERAEEMCQTFEEKARRKAASEGM